MTRERVATQWYEVWARSYVDAAPVELGSQGVVVSAGLVCLGASASADEDLESLRGSLLDAVSSASRSWPRVLEVDARVARQIADGVLAVVDAVHGSAARSYTVEVYRRVPGLPLDWERVLTLRLLSWL